MGHKIDDKYSQLLRIPLLNTEYNAVYIPRKTIIGKLQPLYVADFKVSNKPTELPYIPPESSFQPEHRNTKHSIVLEDAHILEGTKDGLASLLKGKFKSIISKSTMAVGRTNLFQMDIPTLGSPVACKPYPILLKYQKFIVEKIKLLGNVGCISKSLRLWAAPAIIVPPKQGPLNPHEQQIHLV